MRDIFQKTHYTTNKTDARTESTRAPVLLIRNAFFKDRKWLCTFFFRQGKV